MMGFPPAGGNLNPHRARHKQTWSVKGVSETHTIIYPIRSVGE